MTSPLTNDNILLRGSCLKVASVVYGVAIYTGKDTKMMINSKFKSNKMSCIEKLVFNNQKLKIGFVIIKLNFV